MKLNTFEAAGIGISIGAMVLALWLLQLNNNGVIATDTTESADDQAVLVVGATGDNQVAALAGAIAAESESGESTRLIIDDIVVGTGPEVKEGDTIVVDYVGSLQRNGQQFDSSYTRGEPFTFTVGEGRVIAGWERGVIGMQAGGQRVLVIPSDLAYGDDGFGPIPGGAALVFAIEVHEIN